MKWRRAKIKIKH